MKNQEKELLSLSGISGCFNLTARVPRCPIKGFKPLSCRRDSEMEEEEGGFFLVYFIFWLLSRFAGHSCFAARCPCSVLMVRHSSRGDGDHRAPERTTTAQ